MRGGPDCFKFQKSGDRTFTTVNSPVCLFGGEVANPNSHQSRRPPVRRLLLLQAPWSGPLPSPASAMWERVAKEESGIPNGCPGSLRARTAPSWAQSRYVFFNLTHRVPGLRLPRLDSQRHRGFEDPVHDMLTRLHFGSISLFSMTRYPPEL